MNYCFLEDRNENILNWKKHDWTRELICWLKLRWLSNIIQRFLQKLVMLDEGEKKYDESVPVIIILDFIEFIFRKFDAIQILICTCGCCLIDGIIGVKGKIYLCIIGIKIFIKY